MSEEIFEIVDENNKVIGKERRSLVHQKGLFHRSVNIFVFNSEGELFLQQRSADKIVCPLAWDLSVAEHLKPGESYREGAKRGLKEELNIDGDVEAVRGVHILKNKYEGGIKDFEFVDTFKIIWDGKIEIDKKELAQGRFFKISEIKEMIKENKNNFTPWFLEEWKFLGF